MLTKYVIASSTGDTYGSVSSSQWLRQVRLIRVPRLVDQLGQIHVPRVGEGRGGRPGAARTIAAAAAAGAHPRSRGNSAKS
jgi:hypothetical protein